MNNVQMHDLARVGAQTRLAALDTEREELLKLFPDLRVRQQPPPAKTGSAQPAARKRRGMSPAARKAHGERMRAYWATRRAEEAGTATTRTDTASDAALPPEKPAPKRKGMSPEARRAQGERMRAYWAAKRAEKNGAASTDTPTSGGSRSRKGQQAARKK